MDRIKSAHADIRQALKTCGIELERNGSESTDDTPSWRLVMVACARAANAENRNGEMANLNSAKAHLQSAISELKEWNVKEETISGVRQAINNTVNIIIQIHAEEVAQTKEAHSPTTPKG